MNATNKPATPLPWIYTPAPERGMSDRAHVHSPHFDRPGVFSGQGSIGEICGGDAGRDGSTQNAAYIVHACNAYPELVAALRDSVRNHCADDKMFCSTCSPARNLLAKLGEDA